jgi:predicted nuclease of predicted toxin-antitoxin system
MPKRYPKHKLLFDENMDTRRVYPRLNEHFDVKHVRDDLQHSGWEDNEVYQLATAHGRIVVTQNGSDFRTLVGTLPHDPGVIDVPSRWTHHQVDTKLTALLMRHGPAYFAGQYRSLATE